MLSETADAVAAESINRPIDALPQNGDRDSVGASGSNAPPLRDHQSISGVDTEISNGALGLRMPEKKRNRANVPGGL